MWIDGQRVGNVRAAVELVGVDGLDGGDAGVHELVEHFLGDGAVAHRQHFAGFRIDDVAGEDALEQVFARHVEASQPRALKLPHMARRDAPPALHDHVAFGARDVEGGHVAAHPLGHQIHREAALFHVEDVLLEEHVEDVFGGVLERPQHDRGRQLAAPVDADENVILRVELEVEPGAAIGDHAGVVEQLAGGVRLALVVVEHDARRAMQLRNHHPLGAVDDEGAVLGHERDFAHIDLLLLHLLDRLVGRFLVVDDQSHPHPERRGIGEAAQRAFAHVKRRIAEPVIHILEHCIARIAGDREHAAKRRMQPHILEPLAPALQEPVVGIHLNRQQVGDLHDLGQLAEVLADAFLLREAIAHATLQPF